MSTRKVLAMSREALVSQTFLQLADTLVADFDIIDLLTMLADRCVELVDADAAGILLADNKGNLRVMAASSEQARLLELFQLQNEEGPCLDAHASGERVTCIDLREALEQWPRFTPYAIGAGFTAVYALPLRLRDSIIGALNLFRTDPGPMPEADVRLAQALADVASVAILHDQATHEIEIRDGQLQHALDSRIIIEQAKGVLAERSQVDMATAFNRLRTYARSHNVQLTAVAADVIAGKITLDGQAERLRLAPAPPPSGAPRVHGKARILLVEDDLQLRTSTARMLVERGYDVLGVSNGIEALATIESEQGAIELVICDLEMPLMRGDEMARKLAVSDSKLPFIFVTGGDTRHASTARRLLLKPVPETVLLDAIRDELNA